MPHFIQISLVPGTSSGEAVRVNIDAIAFYETLETGRGSKIHLLGGQETFIVRELPEGIDQLIRVAMNR
jgi:hypothetical protein